VKLEEGNYRGAVRLLTSEDGWATNCSETLTLLQSKHPSTPSDRRAPPPSDPLLSHAPFTQDQVRGAILSFPPGSASGPDGLSPQHLKDMIRAEGAISPLLSAITSWCNLIASGSCPPEVKPFFFGGKLLALAKKDGGVRPIAVGGTWRRLTSKLVNTSVVQKLSGYLQPHQLGVGTSGGVEAAVFSARRFLESAEPDCALLKVDYSNAFNSIRRDCIMEAAATHIPEWLPYIKSSYEAPSALFYGSHVISSSEGVQQGDPLGPALFCLTLHEALLSTKAPLKLGYLDDVTLGGKLEDLHHDLTHLREASSLMGLSLNDSKCELIITQPAADRPADILQGIPRVNADEGTLLGVSVLGGTALDKVLADRVRCSSILAQRLKGLQAHDALTILRHSLSIPTLQNILRASSCFNHLKLLEYDAHLRQSLSAVLNVELDDNAWLQASLPVKQGGLGTRSANQVAPSAYLAASHRSEHLVTSLLSTCKIPYHDSQRQAAQAAWTALGGVSTPVGEGAKSQKCWDGEIAHATFNHLLSSAHNELAAARLRAAAAPHSGDWLHVPPLTAAGLRMDDNVLRVAAGLRLGVSLCGRHVCTCGSIVEPSGVHALSCKFNAGRQPRHSLINDILHRSLNKAGYSAVREPSGVVLNSPLRPDGITLIPWTRGRCLAWDFTSPDTLAASHLPFTARETGAAAERAARLKEDKYRDLSNTHHFVAVAVESLGAWNSSGESLVRELGQRLTAVTGDPREAAFLFQRISVAIQRGNAAAVLGSLPKLTVHS
jgi:hypothetical protein